MATYFKVNPKVAAHLKLNNGTRFELKDGNFIIWERDLLAFGSFREIPEICTRIGAVMLNSYQTKLEQDGRTRTELPPATDPRFIMTEPEPEKGPEDTDDAAENQDTGGDQKNSDLSADSTADAKDDKQEADETAITEEEES